MLRTCHSKIFFFQFFCSDDKDDRMSQKVLHHLESIDDDAEKNQIFIVKFAAENVKEANQELEFSGVDLDELPGLILFTEPDRVEVFDGNFFHFSDQRMLRLTNVKLVNPSLRSRREVVVFSLIK